MLETIPPALLDRMEVLQLPGYSEEEKTLIAQKFIIPKQLDTHGLTTKDLEISDAAIRRVIADYTREAGLRNLEREVAAICRKVARKRAEGDRKLIKVDSKTVPTLLGPSRFFRELANPLGIPGVATGLAWTPAGGEILFIEVTGMTGKGGLTLTGLLGESMKESRPRGRTASYLKSHAAMPRARPPLDSGRPTSTSTSRRGRGPQGRPVGGRGQSRDHLGPSSATSGISRSPPSLP